MEDQPPNATGAKVLRALILNTLSALLGTRYGERVGGAPSAFDSGHVLEGMELKRLAGGLILGFGMLANLEGERLKMDVGFS